jgi:hypothetical protein
MENSLVVLLLKLYSGWKQVQLHVQVYLTNIHKKRRDGTIGTMTFDWHWKKYWEIVNLNWYLAGIIYEWS